jgi:hypothetical protein
VVARPRGNGASIVPMPTNTQTNIEIEERLRESLASPSRILYPELSFAIVAAAIAVHKEMGPGHARMDQPTSNVSGPRLICADVCELRSAL